MINEFLFNLIKTFFFNCSSAQVFIKIKNYKNISNTVKIIMILLNIFISIAYSVAHIIFEEYNTPVINFIIYILYVLLISFFFQSNVREKITLTISSIVFAYISMFLSSAISFIILKIFLMDTKSDSILGYSIVGILQFCLIYLFFKIKRFKDGLSFFNNRNISHMMIAGIITGIALIAVFIVVGINTENYLINTCCVIGIVLGIILMIAWIRKSITKYYKNQMKDRTVQMLEEQIKEKDQTIDDLKEELQNVLHINHKYSSRISAMEKAVVKLVESSQFNEEFAEEFADISNALKDLSAEYKDELYTTTNLEQLPKTSIFSIDNILEYMRTEAIRKNIEFSLEINADIKPLVENTITKKDLETLLGDHIKDAIIAIDHSDKKRQSIKVTFDKHEDCYEISFYDTGIEFEIQTLAKLGLEATTTHKDSGGTGIGFMTTFEAMNKTGASLIITEFAPESDSPYTKSITIKFDGKNEYRICSYRENLIKAEIKDRNVIVTI